MALIELFKRKEAQDKDLSGIKKDLANEGFETAESLEGNIGNERAVVVGEEKNVPARVEQMRKLGMINEDLANYEKEIKKEADLGSYIKNNKRVILENKDFSELMQTYLAKDVKPGDGYWDASYQRRTENLTITVNLTFMDAESNISNVQIDLSQVSGFDLQGIMGKIRENQEYSKGRGDSSPEEMNRIFRTALAEALSPMFKKAGFKNDGLRYFIGFSKELMEEINRSISIRKGKLEAQQRKEFKL